jgi:hypothetical protein
MKFPSVRGVEIGPRRFFLISLHLYPRETIWQLASLCR